MLSVQQEYPFLLGFHLLEQTNQVHHTHSEHRFWMLLAWVSSPEVSPVDMSAKITNYMPMLSRTLE